jgi:hypothetical protein
MIRGRGAFICSECIEAAIDVLLDDEHKEARRIANGHTCQHAPQRIGIVTSYNRKLGRGWIRLEDNLPGQNNGEMVLLHGTCLHASGFYHTVPKPGAYVHFQMLRARTDKYPHPYGWQVVHVFSIDADGVLERAIRVAKKEKRRAKLGAEPPRR